MNFYSYFVLSTLIVSGIVTHAYVVHEQFYPAVVYLSTDKMCLAAMYNFAFALFLLFGKLLLRLFIGTLRDLEVEQLVESGRGFLADTILFLVFYAPTIDNREVGTVYLIQYICCVIFMKVFHLTTQIRVSHMFEVGIPRFMVNVKLVSLMCLLFCCDVLALQYFYSVASGKSTFFTWILFEALTMSTMVLVSICKYSIHMVDLRLDNGWPGKSVCLFYIDLIHDVVSMTLFLVFMLTFFVQNPSRLPIYMMADVIQVARKLMQRLRSFRRYRRISLNMDLRFPDATDEEIDRDDHCVICRDSLFEGSKPKKLPCNHIFHIDCLRSWFVMQQVCPTCRAEISADAPIPAPAAPQPAQPPQPPAAPAAAGASPPHNAAAAPGAAAAGGAPAPCACGHLHGQARHPAPGHAPPRPAEDPNSRKRLRDGAEGAAAQHGQRPVGISVTVTNVSSTGATAEPGSGAAGQAGHSHGTSSLSAVAAAALAGLHRMDVGGHSRTVITLGSLGGGRLEGSASLEDILGTLRQAEDMSTFLREQTEFWMEQVRLIQQDHSRGSSVFSSKGAGLMVPPHLNAEPLIRGAGPGLAAAASAAPSTAAAAAPSAAAAAAAPAAVEPLSRPPVVAQEQQAATAPTSTALGTAPPLSAAAAAAPASAEATSSVSATAAAATEALLNGGTGEEQDEAVDQMAELRRAQQDRWKRSGSNLSNVSG